MRPSIHVCSALDTPATIARLYGFDPLDLVLANAHRQWAQAHDGAMTFAAPLQQGDAVKLPSGLDGTSASTCVACSAGQLGANGVHQIPIPKSPHQGAQPPQPQQGGGGGKVPQPSAGGGTTQGTWTTSQPMIWSEIFPDSSGNFTLQPGQRYAVLASVSLNFTLAQIVAKVEGIGFDVTYSWEQGTPTRGEYPVDTWLAGLQADPTSNHRWVYGEGNFTASAPYQLGQDPPWPLTLYHVAHVMEAVPAPPGAEPGEVTLPSGAGCPSIPSRIPWALGGGAVGLGLGMLIGHMWL